MFSSVFVVFGEVSSFNTSIISRSNQLGSYQLQSMRGESVGVIFLLPLTLLVDYIPPFSSSETHSRKMAFFLRNLGMMGAGMSLVKSSRMRKTGQG